MPVESADPQPLRSLPRLPQPWVVRLPSLSARRSHRGSHRSLHPIGRPRRDRPVANSHPGRSQPSRPRPSGARRSPIGRPCRPAARLPERRRAIDDPHPADPRGSCPSSHRPTWIHRSRVYDPVLARWKTRADHQPPKIRWTMASSDGFSCSSRELGPVQRDRTVPGSHVIEVRDTRPRDPARSARSRRRSPAVRVAPGPDSKGGCRPGGPGRPGKGRPVHRPGVSDCWMCSISLAIASMTGLDRGWIKGERSIIEKVGAVRLELDRVPVHSSTIGRRQVPFGPL